MPTTLPIPAPLFRDIVFSLHTVAALVLRSDGTAVDLNPAAHALLHTSGSGAVSFADLFSSAYVKERLRLLEEAVERGRGESIVEIIRGSMRTTTLYPLASDHGLHAALWVSEPNAVPGVRRATYDDLGVLDALTDREREVLALLGTGMSNTQMAKALHRSIRTVHWHCASLCEKLGMTRAELARLAVRQGLASSPGESRGRVSA